MEELEAAEQQQQQPATRHRSTVRRLVSESSRRANTPTAYPERAVQANQGVSNVRNSSARGTPLVR